MWNKFVFTYFNWEVMAQYLPKMVEGFFLTVQLALAVVLTGVLAGLLLALIRSFRVRLCNYAIVFLVDVLRALPPLVIIIMFYFALPSIGIRMSANPRRHGAQPAAIGVQCRFEREPLLGPAARIVGDEGEIAGSAAGEQAGDLFDMPGRMRSEFRQHIGVTTFGEGRDPRQDCVSEFRMDHVALGREAPAEARHDAQRAQAVEGMGERAEILSTWHTNW